MEKEMNRLKVIMCVFGFAFLLRFTFEFAMSFYIAEYIEVLDNYPGVTHLVLFFTYLVIDVLPIGMVFYMHFANYREAD